MRCWSARIASLSKARRSVESSACRSLMLSSSARCGVYSVLSLALLPGRVWICARGSTTGVRQGRLSAVVRGARALIFSSFTSGCGSWYPAKMTLSSECSCLRAQTRATEN